MADVQDIATAMVDAAMALIPRAVPDRSAFEGCRIIAHRGAHDKHRVLENTLLAFETACDAGVWGIECDIRWTADQVPVICHDPTPLRVFGVDVLLTDTTFDELRDRAPDIPTLQECLDTLQGRIHLMLELKDDVAEAKAIAAQRGILRDMLARFEPISEFHMLALDPHLFQRVDFLPVSALLPVSLTNANTLSKHTLTRDYAGLGGHYLLLNERLRRAHAAQGQRLGVGFPASRNSLFRELNRGIEWVFTNDAVKLQGIVDHYLLRDPVS